MAQRAEPSTFNPLVALDAPSREILGRLHADLITIDRLTHRPKPGLAEAWKVSADGRTYRLTLRRGVRFSDGHPFSADDVLFSFAVYQDPAVRSVQFDLLRIDGMPLAVRKLDDHTVEFTLAKPYASAERLFDSIAMLPRHKLEAAWKAGRLRDAWTLLAAPAEIAGLGPFRLKEHAAGQRTLLERNPYYWQAGRPYLDAIEFRLVPAEDTQLAQFLAGELDILTRVSRNAARLLASRQRPPVDLGPGLEYNFVCFNLSPGGKKMRWLGNAAFRHALSLAVDREAFGRLIYQGRATPLWGHVSPGNRNWYVSSLPHPPRDVPAARQRLADLGFRLAAGRLLDRDGEPVTISLLVSASSAERNQMATILQSDWKELGIDVTIAPVEFRALLDRVLKTRQFDAAVMGLGGGDADPNAELNVWLSSGEMHLWNPSQASPATAWEAELDGLLRQQMTAIRPGERHRLYARAQQIIAAEEPMIFLVSPHVLAAQSGRVGNFRPAILDHQTLWNAAELYLK